MPSILDHYKNLQVINDSTRANGLLQRLAQMSESELSLHHVGDGLIGNVFLLDVGGEEPAILECTMPMGGSTAPPLATLFKPHPIFNNRDAYFRMRTELVTLIREYRNADVLPIEFKCPVRRQTVNLRDAGIKQLFEAVEDKVHIFNNGVPRPQVA